MATAATLNPGASGPKQQHLPFKSPGNAAEDSLDSMSEDQQQQAPELYIGHGEDSTSRSPLRNVHKRSGSSRINGYPKDSKDPAILVERYEDKDGEHLVSVRQAWDGERNRKRRNSILLSGRKAGAGWEKSQYDFQRCSYICEI